MIVAVLDTNVLASGFIGEDRSDSTPGELLRRWRAKAFTLVVSEHILTELADTFFTGRLSPAEIADAFDSLRIDGVIQRITADVVGIASHAEDDVVIATALSARADYLVTGVKPLLERVTYRGTLLLSPRQFLEVLYRDGVGGEA